MTVKPCWPRPQNSEREADASGQRLSVRRPG